MEEAFGFVPSIDLEQKMVVVILFSLSNCQKSSLENIVFENGILNFVIEISKNPGGLTTEPDLIDYTISMDKLETIETKVTFI